MMKKESLIFIDTNICIYRTLAYVEPKILHRDELELVVSKINTLSNNNFRCKFVISDLVISELKDDGILFWEINNFCITKLHMNHCYKILSIFNHAKKSMGKLILKDGIDQELLEKIKSYSVHIPIIDQFYLKFPSKLKELTDKKICLLNPYEKQKKISQRPNNLPEETDRKLLGQAIEIKKIHHSDVYIFSNDGDFTEFTNEIPAKFKVSILTVDDVIPSCATS